jgi:hypothetical protein
VVLLPAKYIIYPIIKRVIHIYTYTFSFFGEIKSLGRNRILIQQAGITGFIGQCPGSEIITELSFFRNQDHELPIAYA